MDDKFYPKKPLKYLCENCDFVSCNKKDYEKHLLTLKHKKRTNGGQTDDILTPNHIFNCECGKEYKHRQGLWKHKKICNSIENTENATPLSSSEKQSEIKMLTELVKDVVKQNQDLTNKLVDICKNGTHNTTNNNTHTNSHNKAFNLNFFLNETCKDALNIQDFVSSIKPSIDDLENTGRRGYIEGISNIILKGLNKLEQHFRPIHCSDQKREILYIKDDNQWIKESEDKPILKKAIKTIANENIKKIRDWRDSNPDCTDSDSKKNSLYLKIVSNSMNGTTEEESSKNINKIISNVVKETIIQKEP